MSSSQAMQHEPIMVRTFSFRRSVLEHVPVLAGLDRGCSLTKIIYVDRADAAQIGSGEFVRLTVALFPNSQFLEALEWLRDHASFPADTSHPLHITGAGGARFCDQIKSILGRDTMFIDEFMSQSRGAYYLLANVSLNEMTFAPQEPTMQYKCKIPFLDMLTAELTERLGEEIINQPKEELLPCIFGFMGSGGGFVYIGKDGSFRMVSGLPAAGKTFVGLSRCILGTNNYKEIMEMASRGDRRNVDSQIKEYVSEIPDWEMSPDMPIFSLGKLADTKQSVKDFNKDDIANSLVAMFSFNAMNAAMHVCLSEQAKNVFFGGNLFQGEIFRKEFAEIQEIYNIKLINFHFVNNGHTGALGAMISVPTDMEKYFKS